MRLAPGVVIAHRYRVSRLVGEGGMGVVWAATHTITRRDVAIKLPRESMRADLRHRFLREARAIASLDHPNVIRVHDAFELDDGTPIVIMDLLEGETFGQLLRREQTLSLRETAQILLPVISAVGTAHAHGIIHRDLKPDNVFLTAAEGQRVVKVLDFGIAKLEPSADDQLTTTTGSTMGTPYYMSPEQNLGERDLDQRVDVWSIGVMLYEALSGGRPVEGENLGQITKRLLMDTITPIGVLVPGLPSNVQSLVDRMLARNRAERLADLGEAIAVLTGHCDLEVPRFGAPRSQVAVSDFVPSSDPPARISDAQNTSSMDRDTLQSSGTEPSPRGSRWGSLLRFSPGLAGWRIPPRLSTWLPIVGIAVAMALASVLVARSRTHPRPTTAAMGLTESPNLQASPMGSATEIAQSVAPQTHADVVGASLTSSRSLTPAVPNNRSSRPTPKHRKRWSADPFGLSAPGGPPLLAPAPAPPAATSPAPKRGLAEQVPF